jgi:hypothetical protein
VGSVTSNENSPDSSEKPGLFGLTLELSMNV